MKLNLKFSENTQRLDVRMRDLQVIQSGGGGQNGATFIPSVSLDGIISWTNDRGLPNPEPISIKGPQGEPGSDGKDGYTPINGVDYFDGKDGNDGTDGKNGESAYEVWLNAGHIGDENDFLQWIKGDNDPFGDVVTSITCGGIKAGTSLEGKTLRDVLTMILGIKEAPKSVAEFILENKIPLYTGLADGEILEVAYNQLDIIVAEHIDQGFYISTNADDEITRAGYQAVFDGNTDGVPQVFSMYSSAKIITAYQYQPALDQWLNMGFDGTYWIETGTDTKNINGQDIVYTTYSYNTELMGDAMTATEYWRFEVEAL